MGKQTERLGVFGRSGCGKTTWVKQYIADKRRLVVFDPVGEYDQLKRIDNPDQLIEIAKASYSDFRVRLVPDYKPGRASATNPELLSALCDRLLWIQEPYKRDLPGAPELTLVVDELNTAFPVHGGAQRCVGFSEVCSRGRHSGIEAVGVSQRIAEVSTNFRGNLSRSILFKPRAGVDRKAAAEILANAGAHDLIDGLQPFEYIEEEGFSYSKKKLPKP